MVVFGASGDLTSRKLLPSLFKLHGRGLTPDFRLIGAGRKKLSEEDFRRAAEVSLCGDGVTAEQRNWLERLTYISGDYDDPGLYTRIGKLLEKTASKPRQTVFYLAVPPLLYPVIIGELGRAGLAGGDKTSERPRLVVEKPFGSDLKSAARLDAAIHKHFDEPQVYRIDHYLGKETVQNILIFRFANAIFEPIWSRNYIDNVQITLAEAVGIGHRGGYYDSAGALRDMFQNHMLSMLALTAMEPPVSFAANDVRGEKTKLLRSARPVAFVRGQYGPGAVAGEEVPGYRQEKDVAPDWRTEPFAAVKVLVYNWRWACVPFYLRTGKRLSAKDTEIAITFRQPPHPMFASAGLLETPPNVLVLQIQPEEGISLSFQAKQPGSKICMSTLQMSFDYRSVFGIDPPEAYQRLLLDCMVGDQTLFVRADDAAMAWRMLEPVLDRWAECRQEPPVYPAGASSFPEADRLIEADGRKWRPIADS
jgi:glucose-6-phosphate 1-dehydrogenase